MSEEELHEFFNTYLDTIQQVFGEILSEWDENDYVQPIPDAKTEFQCNNCGKCCQFTDHDVWVYPFDMIKWLQEWENEKNIPLFLSALVPVQDLDDVIGVGLPSQRQIVESYMGILKTIKGKKNDVIKTTLQTILEILKKINPHFNPNSNYCIYYDPQAESGKHCQIYNHRPIQCKTYPYDYPCFTTIQIPGVKEKEERNQLPMCPTETYSNGSPEQGIKISDDDLANVILEKSNYRTSTVLQQWAKESEDWRKFLDFELVDLLLELFHQDITYLTRKQRNFSEIPKKKQNKSMKKTKKPQTQHSPQSSEGNRTKRYIAGKRPEKRSK